MKESVTIKSSIVYNYDVDYFYMMDSEVDPTKRWRS